MTPALGEGFFAEVRAAEFPEHRLRFRNQPRADALGLGALDDAAWVEHFGRFLPLPDNLPAPLALGYHGHQFRVYNPGLGDGRGFLFAQLRGPDGRLFDLSTKGSGTTPWSRGGDGRLTLKGGVREVLATEMLEALGVRTSASLSLIETGERLARGDEPSPTRSSVLVRVVHGSVRFGSFERLARAGDKARLAALVDFVITHYYPELLGVDPASRAVRLLGAVCDRTATLGGQWMAAGFVHGVLNTDNMSLTGESFDYGPFRFLPRYDPAFVAAYFDEGGLYAYGRQPEALRWNLARLVDALSLVAPRPALERQLADFEPRLLRAHHLAFLERLGLRARSAIDDALLVARCLCFLEHSPVGYDQFFFDWYGKRGLSAPPRPPYDTPRFEPLRAELAACEPTHPERLADPYFAGSGPVTLLIDEIEAVWEPIAARDDWAPFAAKIEQIRAFGAGARSGRR